MQDQVVWNTAHGRWYASSIEVGNYMGDHSAARRPARPLLSDRFSVYWLLAFQTVVLALGAVPVYRLAQRRLGVPVSDLLFCPALPALSSVGYVNRSDFHWECRSYSPAARRH